MAIVSLDGRYLQVNRSLCEILGYSEEELLRTTFKDITNPEDVDISMRYMRKILKGEISKYHLEKRYLHADGHPVWVSLSVSLLRDPEDQPLYFIAQVQDTTERKALEEQLRYQAFHDSLTDLPNRVLFMDRLEHALALAERWEGKVAVLYIDLDNFKFINDSLGHDAGDLLLVAVSERLKACLRPGDTVARLGGDEFAILLEDVTDVSDATQVAERIAEALQIPFDLEKHQFFTSASIGIALGTAAQYRPGDLLRNADLAMYGAKKGGKAHHRVFEAGTYVPARRRLKLETDLRRAIEREEFALCYQPMVLLGTNLQRRRKLIRRNPAVIAPQATEAFRIRGMEALMRWQHPERGLVPPSEFVPLAEETGLIVPIGRWALREACRQACGWQEQRPGDPSLVVSVNVSARQFRQPRLVEEVAGILQEVELEPCNLVLEITESAVMEDVASAIAVLRELQDLGIKVALDDFGTGYSSMDYLKRFPVDYLKIGRSFVDSLGVGGTEGAAIVSGMVSLAHALGVGVVAEGVETAEQLARLQATGCEMAQGNYFSEPLSAEAVPALLATKH